MRVPIKGTGDLTSGVALCLHRCGFDFVMTDIIVPTAVRRAAAFSSTVYEGTAVVRDTIGILHQNQEKTQEAVRAGRIAVMVDDRGDIRNIWKPEVIVGAITAKKNLGTATRDVQAMIGVGPGFTVGVDCHCVVETKRDHNLGRCIWDGSAVSNTGMPGVIGGYDKEWIIRASADGIPTGCVSIEGLMEKGQLVGKAGETPIYTEVGGVIGGLLRDGVAVCRGIKSGGVDPRDVMESRSTVSDKASAIGGGVLEAILSHTELIWHTQRKEK